MATVSISVRRAEPQDAGDVADIHDEAWRLAYAGIIPGVTLERALARRGPGWWQRTIRSDPGVAVLDVGGEVAGYVSSGPNRRRRVPARGEIYELYLSPEYQGLGFGTRLFEQARGTLARRFNGGGLVVWSLTANDTANHFYRRLGGRPAARSVDRFGDARLETVGWLFD